MRWLRLTKQSLHLTMQSLCKRSIHFTYWKDFFFIFDTTRNSLDHFYWEMFFFYWVNDCVSKKKCFEISLLFSASVLCKELGSISIIPSLCKERCCWKQIFSFYVSFDIWHSKTMSAHLNIANMYFAGFIEGASVQGSGWNPKAKWVLQQDQTSPAVTKEGKEGKVLKIFFCCHLLSPAVSHCHLVLA